jgi:two-component system nitrogen regulation response regulator GlnG
LQKNVKGFSQSAVDALFAYDWPGNVRQLRSVIRRAVLLADDMILEQHLGIDCVSSKLANPDSGCNQETQGRLEDGLSLKEITHRRIVVIERDILAHILHETGGNKAKAARLLHIDNKTIHSKLKQYGISVA